jgi:hypothetical protein
MALKNNFSSKPNFNIKPPISDDAIVFCPYSLHEELKLKF